MRNDIKKIQKFADGLEWGTLEEGLLNLAMTNGVAETVLIEQLKGYIARMGHPVLRAIALDVDNRRLFFVDNNEAFLFAEYSSPEEGYRLSRVGYQGQRAKDYDPVDLKEEPFDSVETTHEEEDADDTPGMIPAGTPGDQPKDDDKRGFGDEVKKSLDQITALIR